MKKHEKCNNSCSAYFCEKSLKEYATEDTSNRFIKKNLAGHGWKYAIAGCRPRSSPGDHPYRTIGNEIPKVGLPSAGP